MCSVRATRAAAGALIALAAISATSLAMAHGFGQRPDLAVPLWLWLVGAGLTLLLSFAAVIDFLPPRLERIDYPRIDLRKIGILSTARSPWLLHAVRVAAIALYAMTIVAGLCGDQDPNRNLAPTMIWIVVWVGVAFASVLAGDIWSLLNPLRSLFAYVEMAFARVRGTALAPRYRYPSALGVWPGVILMLVFAWAEHIWAGATSPMKLGLALLGYSALMLSGMVLCGRDQWLNGAEIATIVFRLFARSAIFETTFPLPPSAQRLTLTLRPPAVGLLDDQHVSLSMIVFVLLLLAGVTFDGFIETALWRAILHALPGVDHGLATGLAFGLFPIGFLTVFFTCCAAMTAVAGRPTASMRATPIAAVVIVAKRFVMTLVPIAVAYHLAHYLTLLASEGQLAIPLLSDPLGRGWDLFGTAGYRPDPSVLSAAAAWTTVVVLIVLGHVLSVYLAHLVALDLYRARPAAVRSQIPMLVLMVSYTMVSLWILAAPILG